MSPEVLAKRGYKLYHSAEHEGSLGFYKSQLGEFFYEILKRGAHVGEIWVFDPKFRGSWVGVTVMMTPEMKADVEANTKYRFRDPPKISLN